LITAPRAPLLAVTFLIAISAGAPAQRAPARLLPSTPTPQLQLSSDAWIAIGFAAGTVALSPLDRAIAHVLQDPRRQENIFLQRTAAGLRFLGFPGSALIGASVYTVGRVIDNRDVAAFGLHGTEAIFASAAFVYVGKTVLGRARPYDDVDNPFNFKLGRGFRGDRYQSFPSGHTAVAFAVASALTAESEKIWSDAHPFMGPVLYSGAALVGVSRMYHNSHWASDVVAGAAVGILTGQALIRYIYSHNTTLDDWLLPEDDDERSGTASSKGKGAPIVFMWSVPAF
jgi:membrane-associated phospholipid phosphatase